MPFNNTWTSTSNINTQLHFISMTLIDVASFRFADSKSEIGGFRFNFVLLFYRGLLVVFIIL